MSSCYCSFEGFKHEPGGSRVVAGFDDNHRESETDRRTRIRVVFVDAHQMVATGLGAAVGLEPDIQVVGTASTVGDAELLVAQVRPHVVVIGYLLSDADGADGTRRLHHLDPDLNVVMLTASTDDRVLADAL